MPRKPVSTNSFNGVAAGQTATLDLPVGPVVYYGLILLYGTSTSGGPTKANMIAELTQIRLKINGKAQRTFTAAELFAINELHNIPTNAGELYIAFAERHRRSPQGEDALAWGTADVDTFQVEVDIDSGASSPTLDARVVIDRFRRPLGPIAKWKRFNQPVSATGVTVNTTLPKTDDYYSIYAFSSNIDGVEVKVDSEEVFKLTPTLLDQLLKREGFDAPVSGLVPVKFDFTSRVADSLEMRKANGERVGELRVDWDMGSATGFNFITETIGLRD